MISLIAKVRFTYCQKRLSLSRFKAVVEEADFTACALDGRPRYWTGIFRHEAGFFEDGERPPFYDHGRTMGEVLFLLKRYLIVPVIFLNRPCF